MELIFLLLYVLSNLLGNKSDEPWDEFDDMAFFESIDEW